jgi:hypothetical protein
VPAGRPTARSATPPNRERDPPAVWWAHRQEAAGRSPMMPPMPIEGASAWRGPELASSARWIRRLTPEALEEIDQALDAARARGTAWHETTRAVFPLPTVGALLADVARELEGGCGLVTLRGLPVEQPRDLPRPDAVPGRSGHRRGAAPLPHLARGAEQPTPPARARGLVGHDRAGCRARRDRAGRTRPGLTSGDRGSWAGLLPSGCPAGRAGRPREGDSRHRGVGRRRYNGPRAPEARLTIRRRRATWPRCCTAGI